MFALAQEVRDSVRKFWLVYIREQSPAVSANTTYNRKGRVVGAEPQEVVSGRGNCLKERKLLKTIICVGFIFTLWTAALHGQTESQIRDRLVGTWKLVSTEQMLKDGSTRQYPEYGPRGKGFLMYQANGYMCADLVNPDRLKWADPVHPTQEEKNAAADGTFAYCGRYEIDETQKQLVHLPEIATNPGCVGSRQIRPSAFEGNRLVLSDVEKDDRAVARWKIVWEKVQ